MMKETKNGVFTYNNKTYNFDFATSLSAYDKQEFVNTVVHSLVDENGYNVVIKDLIFDFVIIDVFTNIDTSFINVKDGDGNVIHPIIPIEHFIQETDVVDIVKANMEDGLLDELEYAVDLNIRYLTGVNTNPLSESITRLLSTIENKIGELDLDSMMGMVKKFSNMKEDFTIENIINAYMNTDIHKENLSQIDESKEK